LSRSASAAQTTGATVEFVHCIRAFETEFDYVYRALKRHGINASDAEDLAQEVFLVMWRRWADYDTERPLRPWLAGIAFKVAHDHRRRSGREVPGGLVDAEDQAPGAEEHLASARARSLVLKALASLPEKQRTLIVMHDLDGASMREIADTLAVPLFTAYSRLRSARQAFAKSVRRLHTLAAATAGLSHLSSPNVLLQTERVPPPAPPSVRRRAVARVRSLSPMTMPVPATMPPAPPAASALRLVPAGVGVGIVAAVGVLALVAAPHPGGHASVKTHAASRTSSMHVTVPQSKLASRAPLESPNDNVSPALAAHLRSGLLGYWRLDDGYGSQVAHDSSGNGNDCQLRNLDPLTDWTDGPLTGALNLNGRGWLECMRYQSWSGLSDEVTVAAWVKRGATQRGLHTLVSRQKGSDNQDYFLFGFGNGNLVLSSNVWDLRLLHPFPAGVGDRWVHVAATHSADGTARIFINGEEVAHAVARRKAPIGGGTNGLFIGAGLNVPDPHRPTEILEATVDEVAVYDRSLGAEELGALATGVQPTR
jgi:RNA polymerase sigma factor (sigma-70 family)